MGCCSDGVGVWRWGWGGINGEMDNAERGEDYDWTPQSRIQSIQSRETQSCATYCEGCTHHQCGTVGTGFVYRGGMKGELRVDVDTISISAESGYVWGTTKLPSNICHAVLSNKEMRYDMTVAHTFYAAGSHFTDRPPGSGFLGIGAKSLRLRLNIAY